MNKAFREVIVTRTAWGRRAAGSGDLAADHSESAVLTAGRGPETGKRFRPRVPKKLSLPKQENQEQHRDGEQNQAALSSCVRP